MEFVWAIRWCRTLALTSGVLNVKATPYSHNSNQYRHEPCADRNQWMVYVDEKHTIHLLMRGRDILSCYGRDVQAQ